LSLLVFVGWDPRETKAYQVCEHSLRSRASIAVDVRAIVLDDLRRAGLYTRRTERREQTLWDVISEAPMSTEFAISRFFVPLLAANAGIREGWAVFCDCDFLWLGDIAELLAAGDPSKALCCVQHRHVPLESVKMDGQAQTRYARKNWSSLMLFNLANAAHHRLTLEMLNAVPGRDLHRFCWLTDDEIGALPSDWNWLEGSSPVGARLPRAIHFTRGGPWLTGWEGVQYADLWRAEYSNMGASPKPGYMPTAVEPR
jgi:hypothetical protein